MKTYLPLVLVLSFSVSAQSIQQLCPSAEIIKDNIFLKDTLKTLKDELAVMEKECGEKPDAIKQQTLDMMKVALAQISQVIAATIKDAHADEDKTTSVLLNNAEVINYLLKDYANLKRKFKHGDIKLKQETNKQMTDEYYRFQAKLASIDKKSKPSPEVLADLKRSEAAYIQKTMAVIGSTPKGRELVECYNKLKPEHGLLIQGGKLAEVRISDVLKFEDPNFDIDSAGAFKITPTDHGNCTTELAVTMGQGPLRNSLAIAHEMQHGCDSQLGASMALEQNNYDKNLELQGFEKLFQALEAKGISTKGASTLSLMLTAIRNKDMERLPLPPGVKGPPPSNKPKKESIDDKAIAFYNENPDLRDELTRLDKVLTESRDELDKKANFTAALLEAKGHKTEENLFKELAESDEAFCHESSSSVLRWGGSSFALGDYYRTFEEHNLMDEVLKVYALRIGNGIQGKHLFVPNKDPANRQDRYSSAKRDQNGNFVYKQEFLDFLKTKGYGIDF